eukprot:scpid108454/ scgid17296/ 
MQCILHNTLSLLLTACTFFRAHFNPVGSVAVNPASQDSTFWLVSVAVYRSIMALGILNVGCYSRKADSRCIRWSFYVELSAHGKTAARSKWSLKPEVAFTRFCCRFVSTR